MATAAAAAAYPPPRTSATDGLPRLLNNKYRLERRVGEGTYGVVYRATELASGQTVAVKVRGGAGRGGAGTVGGEMRPDDSEEGVPSSALREIALLLELRHDNVVRLREVTRDLSRPDPAAAAAAAAGGRYSSGAGGGGGGGGDSAQLFLVFDFVDMDVHRLMQLYPALGANAALVKYLTYQLLCGLDYCHRRRVLHRDLKPQVEGGWGVRNLLVDVRGGGHSLKIADFGLSRAFGVPVRLLSPEVVTLWYRPPELLLGGRLYGSPVDVWSAACCVLELSNRWPLFPGATEIDTLLKIFEKLGSPDEATWPGLADLPHWRPQLPRYPGRSWEEIAPRLDPAGRDLMRRMLTYDPAQRITAAAALRHPYFADIGPLLERPPQL
ncbi:hypothetical protein HYH02_014740 [Chlamydomonas schloesseri]|uniref:cyclin-dependent kinase n=1 Tax=Chlamydomonas schloesseri TaxID=2026947 RepID=A0A835VSZ9_9CHLO|nr:hypothetical protein HYH02_014740 [Chlamydomonas schloesseri]|eukprot:KAG2426700.1 hypothetical protein HYH02_014740 [Chlamydomonas schloesseri]